jgi:hypothetical protein
MSQLCLVVVLHVLSLTLSLSLFPSGVSHSEDDILGQGAALTRQMNAFANLLYS